jgi:hypothetical protein
MFEHEHLKRIERKLDELAFEFTTFRREIMQTLADLQNDVAAETTEEQSAITLLNGLTVQIAALKTTQTDPATAAAIDALASQVTANTASLATAVTTNTPAAS